MILRHVLATAFLLLASLAAGAVRAEPRLALVIGQGAYAAGELPTAVNDAALVGQTLTSAGFEVVQGRDLNQGDLRRIIRDFLDGVQTATPDTTVVIYVAGHALQVEGEDYLIPTDARIARESDIPIEGYRVSDIIRSLSATPGATRLVILDAARAYPLPPGGQGLARGLAIVEPPPSFLVAFSAAPGAVAPEGQGPYGAYATALVEMMREPGIDPAGLFARVRLRVHEITRGRQTPWHAANLNAPFTFFEPVEATAAAPVRERRIASASAEDAYSFAVEQDTIQAYQEFLRAYPGHPLAGRVKLLLAARREAVIWRRTVLRNSPEAYWTYLRRYPNGPHTSDARRRLTRLSVPVAPPPDFDEVAYRDVPAPLPGEVDRDPRDGLRRRRPAAAAARAGLPPARAGRVHHPARGAAAGARPRHPPDPDPDPDPATGAGAGGVPPSDRAAHAARSSHDPACGAAAAGAAGRAARRCSSGSIRAPAAGRSGTARRPGPAGIARPDHTAGAAATAARRRGAVRRCARCVRTCGVTTRRCFRRAGAAIIAAARDRSRPAEEPRGGRNATGRHRNRRPAGRGGRRPATDSGRDQACTAARRPRCCRGGRCFRPASRRDHAGPGCLRHAGLDAGRRSAGCFGPDAGIRDRACAGRHDRPGRLAWRGNRAGPAGPSRPPTFRGATRSGGGHTRARFAGGPSRRGISRRDAPASAWNAGTSARCGAARRAGPSSDAGRRSAPPAGAANPTAAGRRRRRDPACPAPDAAGRAASHAAAGGAGSGCAAPGAARRRAAAPSGRTGARRPARAAAGQTCRTPGCCRAETGRSSAAPTAGRPAEMRAAERSALPASGRAALTRG